jgi:hypothetical protein
MRYALLALIFVGCAENPTAWQQAMRITGEEVIVKQDEGLKILREHTTALAAIKAKVDAIPVVSESERKEVIQSIDEPQETEREPQHTPSIPVSAPAVRLYVTYADFHCPPCERLREAVGRGDFAGFEVIESESFAGQKSYPATRYQNRDGQWKVRYGYDVRLPQWIRSDVETTNRFVSQPQITNPVVSQMDLVSIHNRLHGGAPVTGAMFPSYRTSAVASQHVFVRSLPRRVSFVGRSNYSTRQSCPTGACPAR